MSVWLILVLGGFWYMNVESFAESDHGEPLAWWPEGAVTEKNPRGHTLVVALHPECPCSRATVVELDKLMSGAAGRLAARVLFVQYPEVDAEASRLWAQARRIPGVALAVDDGGVEAKRFDLRTSGETRLYAADGKLVFQGGITASRGHEGDNPGSAAVLDIVQGGTADVLHSTPVFGCAL